MSKEEYSKLLQSAFDNGIPFINITEFYSYALIPQGDKWLEIAYDFGEKSIDEKKEIDGASAFFKLCEEVEKSMALELKVFYLNKWKEFKKGLSGSEGDKLKSCIKELTTNSNVYSDELPVVFNKEDLGKILSKL
ncbi:hypothetical protein DSAG12_02193 [Promethearchaeum syntrophicum]|uniref:Uncharacterized protein n=1 Tax=Promethearchaeum syntrophicum TaxID=2594042 RepID=A0A5B9DB32_9ARCH|nr:hypothetical protein [Candidatus Prometheoarchaeum syntrophicum]QEE16363.1 hypothetical protein DSAG12_02193 [Candidatus Prometheoarchaeum syntrophicum]